ncbi:MAG: YggT family protein [Anaerolineaceae bacterium]|nr:MAG: YggT family protein [Anaerolineaceae bacterium]HRQ33974.1 YggT family protein [Anaerolineales bacterium]
MLFIVQIISALSQILVLLVFISVILSYFMDPYHPLRRGIDNIVEPMLAPIRRIVPLVGVIDFSPLILILILQFGSQFLIRILLSLR